MCNITVLYTLVLQAYFWTENMKIKYYKLHDLVPLDSLMQQQ